MKSQTLIENIVKGLILYLKKSCELHLLPKIVENLTTEEKGSFRVRKIVGGFLKFLKDTGNLKLLPQILGELQKLENKKGEVVSAFELDPSVQREILGSLFRLFGKNLEVKFTVEPEILGGIRVKVEDFLFDASLEEKIRNLSEKMSE